MTLERQRRAGILVHPTSLPGRYGHGDAGGPTLAFLEWAADAGFSVWQMLPLTPAGPNQSPYSGPSAFAGNPWLISPDRLVADGWLPREAVDAAPGFSRGSVDFERTIPWRDSILRRCWDHFRRNADDAARHARDSFVEAAETRRWLDDWALFASLKNRFGGKRWSDWNEGIGRRRPEALDRARGEMVDEMDHHRFVQFAFHTQWQALRRAANRRGIRLLGDLPFYVEHDSADVWAHPELFALDGARLPMRVAGVPPDYFSDTGQLWGNPVYDWDGMARDGYSWWIDRARTQLGRTDMVRLDHFRAYAAHWEVDAAQRTAVDGRWSPGPGRALFDALEAKLGRLPLVAEDLGSITEDVHALRREVALPGMRVLQFAFDEGDSDHHPDNYPTDCVAYTGTHDNDTARGWFDSLEEDRRRTVLSSLHTNAKDVVWRMIETVFESAADLAVVPLQDLLGLGSPARMNLPGRPEGNWRWRVEPTRLDGRLAADLRALAHRTGRLR